MLELIAILKSNILTSLSSNQFLSGGLIIGLIGGLAVYLRQLPGKLISAIRRIIIIDIEIRNTEECYLWLLKWFNQQKFTRRSSHLTLGISWDETSDNAYGKKKQSNVHYIFSPGIGNHFFRYNNHYFWLNRERKDGSNSDKNGIILMYETIFLSTFRWNRKIVIDMLDEAKLVYFGKEEDGITFYNVQYNDWFHRGIINSRSLDSIILQDDIMNKLIFDIQRFLDSKDRYYKLGIPYHRGYIFSGKPGNGKTATIIALAGYFNKPIFYMNLNSISTDNYLDILFNSCQPNSFLVIEDIDGSTTAYRQNGKKKDEGSISSKASFSALLNNLDGINAPTGLCVFITTNHKERLDPALIRPGRIDVHIEFPNANEETARRMIHKFMGEINSEEMDKLSQSVGSNGTISMAQLQEALYSSSNIEEVRSKLNV